MRNKYNTRSILNIALVSIRHHTELREAARIATAVQIDVGPITKDDLSFFIDYDKLIRLQRKK